MKSSTALTTVAVFFLLLLMQIASAQSSYLDEAVGNAESTLERYRDDFHDITNGDFGEVEPETYQGLSRGLYHRFESGYDLTVPLYEYDTPSFDSELYYWHRDDTHGLGWDVWGW